MPSMKSRAGIAAWSGQAADFRAAVDQAGARPQHQVAHRPGDAQGVGGDAGQPTHRRLLALRLRHEHGRALPQQGLEPVVDGADPVAGVKVADRDKAMVGGDKIGAGEGGKGILECRDRGNKAGRVDDLALGRQTGDLYLAHERHHALRPPVWPSEPAETRRGTGYTCREAHGSGGVVEHAKTFRCSHHLSAPTDHS
jgi:hypothetical protein